jgi:peroxiredoxin Q/BCP
VTVLGASFDTPQDNQAFAERFGYPGRLLSDTDRTAGAAYQTLRPPDDRSPDYAKRRTFVIDPEGVVRKVYAVKDIGAHPQQVLDDLAAMGAPVGSG